MRFVVAVLLLAAGGPVRSPSSATRAVQPPPMFDFFPGDAQYPPSVDRLDPNLCINSICNTPTLRYKGGDASAAGWAAWTYGSNLTFVNSGTDATYNAGSPLLAFNDDALRFNAGDYFHFTDNSYGDVTTEDMVVEMVYRSTASVTRAFGKFNGADGWLFAPNLTGNTPRLLLADIDADAVSVETAAVATGSWNHILYFVDRSGSAQGYLNGAASGAAVAVTTIGSMTVAAAFALGAQDGGAVPDDGQLAYFAMWKGNNWLDSHLQPTLAAARFNALQAMTARVGRGSVAPTAASRSATAILRKVSAGVTKLYKVGVGWVRTEMLSAMTGALVEPAITNLLLQSEDVATSWAEIRAGDTQSLNAAAALAPDGAQTADGNIGEAVDETHGFAQATGNLTAATYVLSVFAKAGAQTWLYLSDTTVANATSYFNLSTCAAGTKGAGTAVQFVENYGNGWCRLGISFTGTVAPHTMAIQSAQADNDNSFAGNAVAVDTYFWGMQVELQNEVMSSYTPTTTATVTRAADLVQYSPTGNVNITAGTLLCSVLQPSNDNAGSLSFFTFSDVAGNNRVIVAITSADVAQVSVVSGGVTTAQVFGTTDVTNGVRHVIAGTFTTDNVRLFVDGSQDGSTTDVSAAMSASAATVIAVGENTAAGGSRFSGLIERCRIWDNTRHMQ